MFPVPSTTPQIFSVNHGPTVFHRRKYKAVVGSGVASSLSNYVTLGKSLELSRPRFPLQQDLANNRSQHKGLLVRNEWVENAT